MSTGWLVGGCDAATPDSSVSRPAALTRYDESVPLPAFAVKTCRPSGAAASQHAALWPLSTDALIDARRVSPRMAYADAAESAASDTNSSPSGPKPNPKGAGPFEAVITGPRKSPRGATAYVSMTFVTFSVAASVLPYGANATSVGVTSEPRGGLVAIA